MIAVLHAYSRVNAGDGLLVDLTLARLAAAGVPAAGCVVFALDPASFADLPRVRAVGTPGRSVDRDLAVGAARGAGLVAASLHGRLGTAGAELAAADAHVGVGGGYLRAGTATNAVGTAVNHLPQLAAAVRTGRPVVYLPVSVGPLAGPVGAAIRRLLARAAVVHVRDDRSLDELAGLGNVVRTPDLVVLDVADRGVAGRAADGPPVLVARALPNAPGYEDRLRALAERLGDVVWAVQAEGRSEKSDRAFYERVGIPAGPPLADVLAAGGHGPVVSARLHGALTAVRAGVPAVHLGYERKSWGAYSDLDLGGWVHDARRFDPDAVAAQVRALLADPAPFWAAAEAAAGRLRERSEALTADLADRLRAGPPPAGAGPGPARRRRRTVAAGAAADAGDAGLPGRRLRALLLTTTLPAAPGDGTPAFVLDLAVALGRDHDVTVLAPRVRGAAPASRVDGVTVVRFPYFPRRFEGLADGAILPNLKAEPWRVVEAPFLVVAFWLAARRLTRAPGADVVNAHWIVPAGIVARLLRRRCGPPYVVTAHGADAYALNGRLPGALKRWVLRGAAAVLPVSRDIAARLGDGAGPAVPMGVDVAALAAAAGGRAPEPGRLLFVGRLAEKKGVDVLLDALPDVPGARLVVVGDGPERAALERRAAERGVADRVAFRGQLPAGDVVGELRRAAAVVIPSRVAADGDTDGTPVVLGEAMAAGVPVVASRLGGLGEQLDDGVTGLLVPPGDAGALAAALRSTIDDPVAAAARAEAARAAAAERLDVRAVAARYGEVLAAAAAGQRLAGST